MSISHHLRLPPSPGHGGGGAQSLEGALLVAGVLVHDEDVAAQAAEDEAQVELPDDVHAAEEGQRTGWFIVREENDMRRIQVTKQ